MIGTSAPRQILGACLSALLVVTASSVVPIARADAPVWELTRRDDPDRTEVSSDGAWAATFTDGTRTVTLAAAPRTFSEITTPHTVTQSVSVRLLSEPFRGEVDSQWLTNALNSLEPDIVDLALQYVHGAAPVMNEIGLQIAGSAQYGPIGADGVSRETSDFSDYLGLPWTFGSIQRKPRADHVQSLDCSGFMRMVFGYRGGITMVWTPDGVNLPRHSWEIANSAPGVITMHDQGLQATDFGRLQVGDLVFFDAKQTVGGSRIDHVGMYLGQDSGGHQRFISSRQTENGPTMGDRGGASILDGTGLYARAFRSARRL